MRELNDYTIHVSRNKGPFEHEVSFARQRPQFSAKSTAKTTRNASRSGVAEKSDYAERRRWTVDREMLDSQPPSKKKQANYNSSG